MRCSEVKKLMMAYIDGKLGESQAETLERHLDACPLCRNDYASEIEMTAAFKTDATGYAGPFFADDVMRWVDSALETEYARFRVNKLQRIVMSVSTACVLIVAYLIWQMDWFGIWGQSSVGAYLAEGFTIVGAWFSAIGVMLQGYFESGQTIYNVSTSQVASAVSGYISTIVVITVLALITCIGLIGIFRRKLVEELRICLTRVKL